MRCKRGVGAAPVDAAAADRPEHPTGLAAQPARKRLAGMAARHAGAGACRRGLGWLLPLLVLVLPGSWAWSAPAPVVATGSDSLLAAAELRIGVERLVKLRLELAVLGDHKRHRIESRRELARVVGALGQLRADGSLSVRRRGQIERLSQDLDPLLAAAQADASANPAPHLDAMYRESEALAARISFISTGLSAERADPQVGALVDLLTRAAAMALRMGKLNFVALRPGAGPGLAVQVDLLQTRVEFKSLLSAIDGHAGLDERMKDELTLVKHQWLLFNAALSEQGLARSPARWPDVGTTTDRIAETLLVVARRAWTTGRNRESTARAP